MARLADIIRNALVRRLPDGPDIHEVECRLYGGWFDTAGIPTEQRAWAFRGLDALRGLSDGVRIVPAVVDGLACRPSAVLRGTYKNGQQKMVDQMMAEDARFFAQTGDHQCLLLISDDDDFFPTVIALAATTDIGVCWLRRRTTTVNDYHMTGYRFEGITDGLWTL